MHLTFTGVFEIDEENGTITTTSYWESITSTENMLDDLGVIGERKMTTTTFVRSAEKDALIDYSTGMFAPDAGINYWYHHSYDYVSVYKTVLELNADSTFLIHTYNDIFYYRTWSFDLERYFWEFDEQARKVVIVEKPYSSGDPILYTDLIIGEGNLRQGLYRYDEEQGESVINGGDWLFNVLYKYSEMIGEQVEYIDWQKVLE